MPTADANRDENTARGERVFSEFAELCRAASEDRIVGERLAKAGTTVRISLATDQKVALTALMDRQPIEIQGADSTETPEVQIVIHWEDLERLFDEDFHLAMAIARGEVTFRGPVRKVLRVMPILQHFAVTRKEQAAADNERQSLDNHDGGPR